MSTCGTACSRPRARRPTSSSRYNKEVVAILGFAGSQDRRSGAGPDPHHLDAGGAGRDRGARPRALGRCRGQARDPAGVRTAHPDVLIVGGGIGGLTLALSLPPGRHRLPRVRGRARDPAAGRRHQPAAACHARAERARPAGGAGAGTPSRRATLAFYSRYGQFIYKEPRGRYAGYDWPQLSIHRADLHKVLLDAARERLGDDAVQLGHRCLRIDQDGTGVTIAFRRRRASSPARSRSAATASTRRCAASSSRRRPAQIFRRQHVARRGALARLPRRRHHGLDGLDDGRQDGDLSGPARHAARPAASR